MNLDPSAVVIPILVAVALMLAVIALKTRRSDLFAGSLFVAAAFLLGICVGVELSWAW